MASIMDNMKQTAQAVCDGYTKWEIEAVMKPRAENCTHHLGPRSLGRPPRDNQQYRKYFSSVQSLFHDFQVSYSGSLRFARR